MIVAFVNNRIHVVIGPGSRPGRRGSNPVPLLRPLHRRLFAGLFASLRLCAVLISAIWVSACGKLPVCRPRPNRTLPRAGRDRSRPPTTRSNSVCALSISPASTQASASQRLQARNAPSIGCFSSEISRGSCRSTKPSRIMYCSIAASVPRMRGSEAGRKSDRRQQQDAGIEQFRAVGFDEASSARDQNPFRRRRDGWYRASRRHARAAP